MSIVMCYLHSWYWKIASSRFFFLGQSFFNKFYWSSQRTNFWFHWNFSIVFYILISFICDLRKTSEEKKSIVFIQIPAIVTVFLSFLKVQVSLWFHFPSTWGTSYCVCFRTDFLVINFFWNFTCFSPFEIGFILSSFFKGSYYYYFFFFYWIQNSR